MIEKLEGHGIALDRTFDVVIVGAGAMGLLLAYELASTQLSVLVLESGLTDSGSEEDFLSEMVGKDLKGASQGRRRAFGGATTRWGGQHLPLRPVVFENRSWVAGDGWPISREDLMPYFDRVATTVGLAASSKMPSRPTCSQELFDGSFIFEGETSLWQPSPNFAKRFGSTLRSSANVTILLGATVLNVSRVEQGPVRFMQVVSSNGSSYRAVGRTYVLAAGSIESARLMLSSGIEVAGPANSNLVGTCLQDHVSIIVGRVRPYDRERFHGAFENRYVRRVKHSPKLVLKDEVQRQLKLLNAGVLIRFPSEGAGRGLGLKELVFDARRGQFGRGFWRSALRAVGELPENVRIVCDLLRSGRVRALREGPIYLEVLVEQPPQDFNSISLSEEVDEYGMRAARISWSIPDACRETVQYVARRLQEEFERLEVGVIELFEECLEDPVKFVDSARDCNHQMGTLRMSSNLAAAVVTSDSQVRGVENLFVAGCAVFPVSGYSNPTHTGLALTIRLGDHLRNLLEELSEERCNWSETPS